MKRLILYFLLICLSTQVAAQVFNHQIFYNDSYDGDDKLSHKWINDIDQDGDLDILIEIGGGEYVRLYENNGSGVFEERVLIEDFGDPLSKMVDVDQDGDLDWLRTDWESKYFEYYENVNGDDFEFRSAWPWLQRRSGNIVPGDFNNDGYADFIAELGLTDSLFVFQLQLDGSYERHFVDVISGWLFEVKDLDADGLVDIVYHQWAGRGVGWYRNNGDNTFTNIKINDGVSSDQLLLVADLDGDDDLDIIYKAKSDEGICWLQNNGSGGFGDVQIVESQLSGSASLSSLTGDFNGDGLCDILVYDQVYARLEVLISRGGGQFSSHLHDSGIFTVSLLSAGDFNGDSKLDVLCNGYSGVSWLENQGDQRFNQNDLVISIFRVDDVIITDLNGGAHTDILINNFNESIIWGEVVNDEMVYRLAYADRPFPRDSGKIKFSMKAADLNNDDLTDIVVYGDATIVGLIQNHEHKFNRTVLRNGTVDFLGVHDLDQDGLVDILISNTTENQFIFLQNLGGMDFTERVLIDDFSFFYQAVCEDMDGDGDLDLAGVYDRGTGCLPGDMGWYENNGTLDFSAVMVGATDKMFQLDILDMDFDGDLDFNYRDGVYINNGNGQYIHQDHPSGIPLDFDEDLDMDFLFAKQDLDPNINKEHNITLKVNNGDGQYLAHKILIGSGGNFPVLNPDDFDRDGFQDIFYVLTDYNSSWFEIGCFIHTGSVSGSIVSSYTANPVFGVPPLEVRFENQSTGPILEYAWQFGDGSKSTELNPTHTYTEPGLYSTSLDANGFSTGDQKVNTGHILVMPEYAPVYDELLFTDQFQGCHSALWRFLNDNRWSLHPSRNSIYINTSDYEAVGQGALGELAVVDTPLIGDYTVSFRVKTLESIYENPKADFAAVFGYKDSENYYFVYINTDEGETVLHQIQNGERSTIQTRYGKWLTHHSNQYVSVTCRNNSVWVRHGDACLFYAEGLDTDGKVGMGSYNDMAEFHDFNILVPAVHSDAPTAAFAVDTASGTAPFTVQFSDSSSGEITDWLWNFGDGSSSTEQHPQHTYQSADTFDVTLTVTGPGGSDSHVMEDGIIVTVDTAVEDAARTPSAFKLYANSPNPFNPVTQIQYDVKAAGPVKLEVYDVRGRLLRTLLDEVQNAGRHTAFFDADGLPSGIYILRFTAGTFTDTRKMVLSR